MTTSLNPPPIEPPIAELTASPDSCSIASTLEVIGDRWTLLILRNVFRGNHRFSGIQQDLGVARNLLTDRLQRLVEQDVLARIPYQDRPVRHEYRLTPKGADLSASLMALMRWGDTWYAESGPPTLLVHAECGTALQQRVLCPQCDTDVAPGQIRSRPGPGWNDSDSQTVPDSKTEVTP